MTEIVGTSNWINPDVLAKFVSPGINVRLDVNFPDLTREFANSGSWLQKYVLSSVFNGELGGVQKLYAESIIARSQIVLATYATARDVTGEYMANWKPGAPGVGRYLASIGHWESVFLNLHIVSDIALKFSGTATFPKNTSEDRLRSISNRIKHVSEDIKEGKLTSTGLPMWFTATGFETSRVAMEYGEMVDLVRSVAQIAECLCTPSQANDKAAQLLS